MVTEIPPPRRKLHFMRWLVVFIAVAFAWSGWRAYAFRSALSQAKALGWEVEYTDPAGEIRADWKAAFKIATWTDGVTELSIPRSTEFVQHLAVARLLNPRKLEIDDASTLGDLSSLKRLARLEWVWLVDCTNLGNVDALGNLSTLQSVFLDDCPRLTNVDALKSLTALREVSLSGCSALKNVDALKDHAALKIVSLRDCAGLENVDALANHPALAEVELGGCTALRNVDALRSLPALKEVNLDGSTGLTSESVAQLRAAQPNARIVGP